MHRRQLLRLGLAGGGLLASSAWLPQAKAAQQRAAWEQFCSQPPFQVPAAYSTW